MRPHAARAEFLRSLAHLIGCTAQLEVQFPDGCRPDVLGVNRDRRMLFLGEAKDTETPGDAGSRFRLSNYVRWLSAYRKHSSDARCIFALCFGTARQAAAWAALVEDLSVAARLEWSECRTHDFGSALVLLRVTYGFKDIRHQDSAGSPRVAIGPTSIGCR